MDYKFKFSIITAVYNVEAYLDAAIESIINQNIGFLKNKKGNLKTFDSIEYGIVEYFYDLVEKKSSKRTKKMVPYKGDSKYIEDLIVYYTENIYTNVDTVTANRGTICYTIKLENEGDIDRYVADIKDKLMEMLDGHDVLHII